MARHIAQQLTGQVQRALDGGVDIRLHPEELGRVGMHIMTTDTGVTMHLTVDRPETFDLMRRNLDQLAADFRELGYASVDISLGTGSQRSGGSSGSAATGAEPDRAGPDTPAAMADVALPQRQAGLPGRMDIRL